MKDEYLHFGRRPGRFSRSGLNFARKRRRVDKSKVRYIFILAVQIAAVVLLAYLLIFAFGTRIVAAGESMEPTIGSEDKVLINRLSYVFSSPETDDVVAFRTSDSLSQSYSIKRVIGTPGDTVVIKNGYVYLNGQLHSDIADTDYMTDYGLASAEITLGDGEYFVLGDNRNNSEDSRYASVGNITKDEIVGKVWLDVTPSDFGTVH